MRSFYLSPAFEMFALHVTLLTQSRRSAQLFFLLVCLYPCHLCRRFPLACKRSVSEESFSNAAQPLALSYCMHSISPYV